MTSVSADIIDPDVADTFSWIYGNLHTADKALHHIPYTI
jgi:hypothetical protein